jgi:hypothetical protein
MKQQEQLRTYQQQVRLCPTAALKQLEQNGTPTAVGTSEPVETPVDVNKLTTVDKLFTQKWQRQTQKEMSIATVPTMIITCPPSVLIVHAL